MMMFTNTLRMQQNRLTSQALLHRNLVPTQTLTFTRSYKKILLLSDVSGLGFRGEICFVKPGHAFNSLVPSKQALFYSDPARQEIQE